MLLLLLLFWLLNAVGVAAVVCVDIAIAVVIVADGYNGITGVWSPRWIK